MKKHFSGILILLLPLLLLGLYSCTAISCLDETEAYLKISFYSIRADKLQAPDSLTVYGVGKESSKIYNKSTGVEPALIPLNASTDYSEFVIRINGISDTVKFIYTSFPHLVTKECGYSFYHTLDTTHIFTGHIINDMYFGNRNITTINEENVRIYY